MFPSRSTPTACRTACSVCDALQDSGPGSKYKCPRCLGALCSQVCYSKHGSECTEAFFRERVYGVLSLEKKEESVAQHKPSADPMQEKLADIAEKLMESGLESSVLETDEMKILRKALRDFNMSRAQASLAKVQFWWLPRQLSASDMDVPSEGAEAEMDRDDGIEVVRVSRSIVMYRAQFERDMIQVRILITSLRSGERRSELPPMPPALALQSIETTTNTSSSSLPKVTKALTYHIFAILLGYVVMMRSTGGDWTDSLDDAYQLFILSCPALSSRFQASSVADVVTAWLEMSPPTLDRRRKSWTILFQDALYILTTNSGMLYALMDCWMMCAAVEGLFPSDIYSTSGSGRVFVVPTVCAVLQGYTNDVFFVRAPKRVDDSRRARDREADRVTRKLFFLVMQSVTCEIVASEADEGSLHVLIKEAAQYLHEVNPGIS